MSKSLSEGVGGFAKSSFKGRILSAPHNRRTPGVGLLGGWWGDPEFGNKVVGEGGKPILCSSGEAFNLRDTMLKLA